MPLRDGRKQVTTTDICSMSDAYVDAALHQADGWHPRRPLPLLISSDGLPSTTARAQALVTRLSPARRVVWTMANTTVRWPSRDEKHAVKHAQKALYRHTNVSSPPSPPPLAPGGVVPAAYVDLLLLIRARYFLGNAGSTFSANVARVRTSELGETFSNLRSCHRYP
jgi:hypothetical protein